MSFQKTNNVNMEIQTEHENLDQISSKNSVIKNIRHLRAISSKEVYKEAENCKRDQQTLQITRKAKKSTWAILEMRALLKFAQKLALMEELIFLESDWSTK